MSSSSPAPEPGRLSRLLGITHGAEIIGVAAPIVLTMLSQTLMWSVDTALLGRVSSLALAAGGLGGLITWTGYSLFNNLSRVTNTFVSQANGRGDDETVGAVTWQGLYLAIVTGAVLTVLGQLSDHILVWTKNSEAIQHATYTYIRLRTLSAFGTQATFVLMGFFQGRKDVRTPMIAGIVGNIVNAALDVLLIFGVAPISIAGWTLACPAMGVAGAALATTIAVYVNLLLLVVWALKPAELRTRFRIHQPRRPDPVMGWRMMRVGLPAATGNFIDMLAFSVFTALIGRTGESALAASQITIQLLSFSFMPMVGLTVSATVLCGNAIGRRDVAAADRYGREFYRVTLLYATLLLAVLASCGSPLFRVFTDQADILAFAAALSGLAAIFQVFDALRMIGIGILEGAGDTAYPMWVAITVLLGVFVPATYWAISYRGGTVTEAWLIASGVYALMACAMFLRFRSGAWQLRTI